MADRLRGCLRRVLGAALVLALPVLGGLAWDVWQVRLLRPPADRSFEGFLKEGRAPAGLKVDTPGGRLYWTAPPARTIARYSQPPVYAFDRRGALVDWTPGDVPGMISGSPVASKGRDVDLAAARAWLRGR